MKNNRASVSEKETQVVSGRLGDPQTLRRITGWTSEGTQSVILINTRDPDDLEIYERLKNDKENFEIQTEENYGARTTVFILIHYIRKTECELDLSKASYMKWAKLDAAKKKASRKSPRRSSKKSDGRKIEGFQRS